MNGILLIDKPAGITSAEVVRRVKQRVGVKVGHLGTLDPFATGLLPLCLGEATKIAQFLNTADKRYEGVIQLGWSTDTGDPTGQTVSRAEPPDLSSVDLAAVARRFTGDLQQVPPMYSALKRDGVPLYRLARRGVEVERVPRPVRIERLVLEPLAGARLGFALACSKGTYVRVLAEEIGSALGSAAHLDVLRRTGFGSFDIAAAVALADWDAGAVSGLVALPETLAHLPRIPIDDRTVDAVRHGKAWVLRALPPPSGDTAVLIGPDAAVVAVVTRDPTGWAYARVLACGPT